MSKVAFVFPGQGAQKVGMCKDFYDNYACAKKVFEEADEALGFSISKLCFEGPEEDLRLTKNTQPAILTCPDLQRCGSGRDAGARAGM